MILFQDALIKIKKDQQKTETIVGDLNEITTQQVEKFCKMAVDIGSGDSRQEAAQNTFILDTP